MRKDSIVLDWTRLLGFSQADPARISPGYMATIGGNGLAAPLQAKVGDKGGGGAIGRPQELGLAKN